jgi:hypothetical protein
MLGARGVNLLRKLIKDIEEAFWRFFDQKWKDSLNMATAEPLGNKAGLKARGLAIWGARRPATENQGKPQEIRPAGRQVIQRFPEPNSQEVQICRQTRMHGCSRHSTGKCDEHTWKLFTPWYG